MFLKPPTCIWHGEYCIHIVLFPAYASTGFSLHIYFRKIALNSVPRSPLSGLLPPPPRPNFNRFYFIYDFRSFSHSGCCKCNIKIVCSGMFYNHKHHSVPYFAPLKFIITTPTVVAQNMCCSLFVHHQFLFFRFFVWRYVFVR